MAQLLFINASGYTMLSAEADKPQHITAQNLPAGSVGILGYAGIMLADGSFKDFPRVPGIGTEEIIATPGGGWVIRGLVDLAPGVSREDGPCVSDISTPLIVLDRNGTQQSFREIHRQCHPAYLVGVHSGRAFLARDNNFVTIDLASGRESVFKPLGPSLPARSGIEDGTLYSLNAQAGQCAKLTLRTIEIATGADTSREITPPSCGHDADRMRLSPDGRRIAFTYTAFTTGQGPTTTVVIADAVTGAILGSHPLPASPGSRISPIVGGMAWVDADTVRVAYAVPPSEGVHHFRDIVETIDVST